MVEEQRSRGAEEQRRWGEPSCPLASLFFCTLKESKRALTLRKGWTIWFILLLLLGWSACEKGKLSPEAQKHFERGRTWADQGDYVHAIQAYLKVIALAPNFAQAHHNLANAYFQHDEYDKAEEAYQRAIALAPDFAKAHYNLAALYVRQTRYAEAIEQLLNAVEADSGYALAYNALGR